MGERSDGPSLRALPKVDLHRHLEGCARLATIIDLAREADADLPAWTPQELAPAAQVFTPVGTLEEALARLGLYQRSFRSYDAVTRITREAVEDLAADNVRLAELRFSPDYLCSPAGLDWDGALEAITEGLAVSDELDVAVGLICIVSRDFGADSARRTVDWAVRHRDDLVGFDVAGPELGYPPTMFRDLLAPIHESELGLTTHYGESGPPEYPKAAIEVLRPTRLGHGVSVAWDAEVTALARDRGVTLEMCPTSNWLTGAVRSPEEHPARRLLHEGVRVTLNTDNTGLMAIDLTNELTVARERMGFTLEELAQVTGNAIDASFLPEDTKARVRSAHFGWIDGG